MFYIPCYVALIIMVDFNGNEIKIGSKVFWLHKLSEPVIGIVSQIKGKKTFIVKFTDVVKFSENGEKWYNNYKRVNINTSPDAGYVVKSDCCLVVR